MNAISRYLPLPVAMSFVQNVGCQMRERTYAGLGRFAYARSVHAIARQLGEFEVNVHASKHNLTLVVARKLYLRSHFSWQAYAHDSVLQRQYDRLHDYELRLITHIRQCGGRLESGRQMLQAVRGGADGDGESQTGQLVKLVDLLQSARQQHHELSTELGRLLEATPEHPALELQPQPAYSMQQRAIAVVARLRHWMPA